MSFIKKKKEVLGSPLLLHHPSSSPRLLLSSQQMRPGREKPSQDLLSHIKALVNVYSGGRKTALR